MSGEFEIEPGRLGRPDGHQPSEANWAEAHILCVYCHVQVWESVFFLEPCAARVNKEKAQ